MMTHSRLGHSLEVGGPWQKNCREPGTLSCPICKMHTVNPDRLTLWGLLGSSTRAKTREFQNVLGRPGGERGQRVGLAVWQAEFEAQHDAYLPGATHNASFDLPCIPELSL